MIGVVQAFAPHYARARVLFLEAAATAGLASESHVLPHTGLHGETLATDVALDGATDASHLLLVTSGSRGVDGALGSGVQVFALHDQEWRDKARNAGLLHAALPPPLIRGWAFFERVRAARQKAPDLGAKHRHRSGCGEHLPQRAGAFWFDERA